MLKRILKLHTNLAKKVSTNYVAWVLKEKNDSLCVVDKTWPQIFCHFSNQDGDSISRTLKISPLSCADKNSVGEVTFCKFQNLSFMKPYNFCLHLLGLLG